MMKNMASIVPSKKAVSIFFAVYTGLFVVGVLGVITLPEEERAIRKVAFVMSYFFGLPVVVSAGLVLLRKIGAWNGK
jgi:energy-converting hydrogenase Eha subunit A